MYFSKIIKVNKLVVAGFDDNIPDFVNRLKISGRLNNNILNPGKMGLDTAERDDNVQFMYDEYVSDSELWGTEK